MFTQDELIAKLRKCEIEEITIPEWGEETLQIRSWTGAQREEVEEILMKNRTKDLRGLAFIYSVCTDDGTLRFKKSDLAMISESDGRVLDRVWFAALRLNKMTEEDILAAKKN